ncbi:MAG: glutamine synthetase III, partial [Lentisphaeria bacterium]|nr:glutamine synthetase III [Lentisphaeria bacterium]
MSGSKARLEAISAVNRYEQEETINYEEIPSQELFGANVFSIAVMQERLPKAVFKKILKTIEDGEKLDTSIADV